MRILWVGVPPWWPTGYGQQAAYFAPRLRDAGHEVILSAVAGADGGNPSERHWDGIEVLPSPHQAHAGPLVLADRIQRIQPDLIITLCDLWNMPVPGLFRELRTLAWVAGDTHKLSAGDARFLQESGARPIAMSRHMQRILEEAGYDAPYVPHGIDTTVFVPPEDRHAVRQELDLEPDSFAVGILGRNIDPHRKALPNQLYAFARYLKRNPRAVLFLHTMMFEPGSTDLGAVCRDLGLKWPSVRVSHQPALFTNEFPQYMLVKWYGALDVLMNCSRGEGFGLATVEAQACGTPAILSDNTTGPELVGPGWLVKCDPFWREAHEAWWSTPLASGMVDRLGQAAGVKDVAGKRAAARSFAQGFDVEAVWPLFEKAVEELSQ